jgi:TolA-binding protein
VRITFVNHQAWIRSILAAVLMLPAGSLALGQTPATTDGARRIPDALNFANGLYRDRRYDLASEEYQNFLNTNPNALDAADARFGLASARLFLGRYKEARQEYEKFLKDAPANHPNIPTATFRVGETAYLLGDLEAAKSSLEAFLKASPNHRNAEAAWSHLGDVHFRVEAYAKAQQAYENVIKIPNARLADRAKLRLGQTLSAKGETDSAVKILKGLAEAGSAEWADKAWFEIGRVEVTAGRFDRAVDAYASLVSKTPKSPLVSEAQLQKAEALGRLERRDEAETLLKPLLNGNSPALAARAADALGSSLMARGKVAEALTTFDEATTKFLNTPTTSILRFHAAEAAQALGKADDARSRFLKASEAGSDDSLADDALLRAAAIALEAGKLDDASALAGSLTVKFPKTDRAADSHLIEARVALARPKPDAKTAIQLLTQALEAEKPNPATAQALRYYLALAYRADGQSDKASAILDTLAKTPSAPGATDAQFMLGQGHIESGRFAEAIPALEKYLATKPKGEVADFALAHIAHAQLETGQADAARKTLVELTVKFPQSKALAVSRLRVAEAALSAKTYDRAAEFFKLAAEGAEPAIKARAQSGLGWALLQSGKSAEAAAAFDVLLKASPDDPLAADAALARAKALETAKQVEPALAAYLLVMDRYAKSEVAGPAALGRARLLVEAKKPAEAAELFARIERDFPKATGQDDLIAERAWALVDAEKTAEADALFEKILKDYPSSPRTADARYNLAESAFVAKKFDKIAALVAPVISADSKAKPSLIQSSLYRLGRTQVELKAWKDSTATFGRLIKDYPDGSYRREAQFWNGEVAFQSGDVSSAETTFAALISEPVQPTDAPGLIQTAKRRRIQGLVQLAKWKDALAAADAYSSTGSTSTADPHVADVDYARGRAYQGLAQFDEARAAFGKVIEARKGSELAARAQFMRGETYFHQKDYRKALSEFLKVDYLYDVPTWQASALLEAGKVHEQLGQWAEAAETYERLRSKFPADPNAAKAQERLDAAKKRVDGTARANAGE